MSPARPHDEESIRRALAEARHDAPVPDDVAARLDETLADLVAQRAALPPDSPQEAAQDTSTGRPEAPGTPGVVPLRRRRRWLPALAAAGIAVVALASAPAWLPELSGGAADDARSTAGSASDGAGTAESYSSGDTKREAEAVRPPSGPTDLTVDGVRLRDRVRALLAEGGPHATSRCARDAGLPGRVGDVTYRDRPAVLQVEQTTSGRVVRIYTCPVTSPVRTFTLEP